MLPTLRRLWDHLAWADDRLLSALEAAAAPPGDAIREYAHILGADEVWLARLEGRASEAPVWPAMALPELRGLAARVHDGYARYLSALTSEHLADVVSYTTSDGRPFSTPVHDILLHVALHAQYHRGKINLLLRQAGLTPAPTDFIGFVRGAAAATTVVGPR